MSQIGSALKSEGGDQGRSVEHSNQETTSASSVSPVGGRGRGQQRLIRNTVDPLFLSLCEDRNPALVYLWGKGAEKEAWII